MVDESINPLYGTKRLKNLPEAWSVDVVMNHPPFQQMDQVGTNQWEFKGVLLPGQGFEIRIRPKEANAPGDRSQENSQCPLPKT